MELNLNTHNGNQIKSYEVGTVVINEISYDSNIIVTVDTIVAPWMINNLHAITMADIQPIIDTGAEIVLLGTGATQMIPGSDILAKFYQNGMGIEVMDTGAACRTFNLLASEGRNVAAALII